MRTGGLATIATAIILGTAIMLGQGGGGAPGFANIWIDTSGGTCADVTTAILYPNDGTECATLNDAYQVAEVGDIIGWRTGTYNWGEHAIVKRAALYDLSPGCDPYGAWGAASVTNCIKVVPDGGNVLLNGSIESFGSALWIAGTATGDITAPRSRTFNIEVDGYINSEATASDDAPDHIIYEGVDALQVGAYSSDHIAFYRVDAGPFTMGAGCGIVESSGGSLAGNNIAIGSGKLPVPSFIRFEEVFFHNAQRNQAGADADCHTGGFFFKNGNNAKFIRNAWAENAVYNMQIQKVGVTDPGPQPHTVTVENSWLNCPVGWIYLGDEDICAGQADIQFNAAGLFDAWLIRYNSFAAGTSDSGIGATFTNTSFLGNAGARPSTVPCTSSGITWGYNVWDTGTCGGTDIDGEPVGSVFTSIVIGSENFHLVNGSVLANNAVATGTGDYALATDFDGQARPIDANRDAGSDER